MKRSSARRKKSLQALKEIMDKGQIEIEGNTYFFDSSALACLDAAIRIWERGIDPQGVISLSSGSDRKLFDFEEIKAAAAK